METKCFNTCRWQSFGTIQTAKHSKDENLKDFQAKYFQAQIDKDTRNVAFICQRFYAQVWIKNLGLQNSITYNTYCCVFKPNTDVIKSNQTILKKKIKLNLSSDDSWLLHLCWLPKLQKHPTGSRYYRCIKIFRQIFVWGRNMCIEILRCILYMYIEI